MVVRNTKQLIQRLDFYILSYKKFKYLLVLS